MRSIIIKCGRQYIDDLEFIYLILCDNTSIYEFDNNITLFIYVHLILYLLYDCALIYMHFNIPLNNLFESIVLCKC
jgi:hypothetical protein